MFFRFLNGKGDGKGDKDEEGGLTGTYCRCCQGEGMKRDGRERKVRGHVPLRLDEECRLHVIA